MVAADDGQTAVGPAAAAIRAFVSAGGGLLIVSELNYWAYLGGDLPAHPANQVLIPMGIYIVGDWGSPPDYTVTASPPSQAAHVDSTWDVLVANFRGNTSSPYYRGWENSKPAEGIQVRHTAARCLAVRCLPQACSCLSAGALQRRLVTACAADHRRMLWCAGWRCSPPTAACGSLSRPWRATTQHQSPLRVWPGTRAPASRCAALRVAGRWLCSLTCCAAPAGVALSRHPVGYG